MVTRPHGIRGKVKIRYYGEDLNEFSRYREIVLRDERGVEEPFEVVETTPQPPLLILKLRGVDRMEDAEALVGDEVLIRKDLLPDLEEGEYYWHDLLGMEVENETGKSIGRVTDILRTGANDVYVVQGKREEFFLPATEEVIKYIDLKRRVITAHWMEGLWEKEDEV
jgi:16S rRNA processing protein RimM